MRWFRIWLLLPILTTTACRSGSAEVSPPTGLEEGYRAPDLEGIEAGGDAFALEDAGQPRVLVFYSSATCGLCRVQLENLQAHLPAYDREGARVIAITLDSPEDSRAFREHAALGYPLVSVDSSTFQTWVPRDSALGGPLPATYILDRAGVIRFRHIGRNASDRISDAAMVSILSDLNNP